MQSSSCSPPYAYLFQSSVRSSTCNSSVNSQFFRDYVAAEINVLLWISLIAVTFFLLREVAKLFRVWFCARKIPGPPCPSFDGHFKLISRENIIDLLSDLHQEYGSIVKLWLGPSQLLVSMKEPGLIKEMLSKAEDKSPLGGRAFRVSFGRLSLFVSSFEKVQKKRESLMMELNRKLAERESTIAIQVVDCVVERISQITDKGSIDCNLVSQHMACTIMGATLFGETFLAWSKAAAYEELLMMVAKDACFWASYRVAPLWKRGFWIYRQLCTKLKFLTQDIVQLHGKNCRTSCQIDDNSHVEKTNSILEILSGAGSCSTDEPCSNAMGIMFHGCITTAGLISNIMAKLVIYPEIQAKIYSEIIMAKKQPLKQDGQNIDQMVLLLATVYESARVLPSGSLLQRCSLKHDLNLRTGVTIPAGAVLAVPVQLVHMDGLTWGNDANEFNPYRFLTMSGKRSDVGHITSVSGEELVDLRETLHILNEPSENAAFLPFGSGSRACVGQKFVIQGVAALLASLLERYEIKLQPGCENDLAPMMKESVCQLLPSPNIVFVQRETT